jgi:NAD(P)-dependent dehydrogenase (short-subunit alcohol dehydrogenase family)
LDVFGLAIIQHCISFLFFEAKITRPVLKHKIAPRMASYVITGSSRGIGLGLVSLLASLPASQVGKVFATSRQNNSSKLKELIQQHPDRVQFVQLDVTDKESVKRAAAEIEHVLDGKPLDILINNAGFMPWTPGGVVDT